MKRITLLAILFASIGVVAAQEKPSAIFPLIKTSQDPRFLKILRDSISIKKEIGTDQYHSRLNRMIFKGDIEPLFAEAKTWNEINKALQSKYGAVGEEAYLVTRAGISMQMKQWPEYLPLAKRLLEKYGSHLSEADRNKHEEAIKVNQK